MTLMSLTFERVHNSYITNFLAMLHIDGQMGEVYTTKCKLNHEMGVDRESHRKRPQISFKRIARNG
jgi:hypothetical protein